MYPNAIADNPKPSAREELNHGVENTFDRSIMTRGKGERVFSWSIPANLLLMISRVRVPKKGNKP